MVETAVQAIRQREADGLSSMPCPARGGSSKSRGVGRRISVPRFQYTAISHRVSSLADGVKPSI
jgi:hypothetical protein